MAILTVFDSLHSTLCVFKEPDLACSEHYFKFLEQQYTLQFVNVGISRKAVENTLQGSNEIYANHSTPWKPLVKYEDDEQSA